ncbi:hypothetical protein G6F40_014532 [Rhizopus arrhizus]|nr:hypothetical protein G6F40_014532 [Rhizopus arrhizus]
MRSTPSEMSSNRRNATAGGHRQRAGAVVGQPGQRARHAVVMLDQFARQRQTILPEARERVAVAAFEQRLPQALLHFTDGQGQRRLRADGPGRRRAATGRPTLHTLGHAEDQRAVDVRAQGAGAAAGAAAAAASAAVAGPGDGRPPARCGRRRLRCVAAASRRAGRLATGGAPAGLAAAGAVRGPVLPAAASACPIHRAAGRCSAPMAR